MSITTTDGQAPKRLAAYVRVSAVRGRSGEKFTSPDDQERHIRAWADAHGHIIVNDGPDDGVWRELDVSGGSMDRPKLNDVLARVEAGELDGLVVYSLDRFGRTLIGALTILERLHENGKTFASVVAGFDLDTDIGRMVLGMMLNLAQWERDRIRTRWRDTRADRVLTKGWHISRWVPFGYRREELVNPRGEPYLGRLVPDPVWGPVAAELFRRRAAGESYTSLAQWLRSIGATTSRGTSAWSLSSVRSVIRNRVYLGEARGGVKGTPANPDAHEPLTDEATWLAANRVRPPRETPAAAYGTNHTVLGMGKVRCAQCRYVVAIQRQPKADGAFNYLCDRAWRGKGCSRPAVNAAAVRPNGAPAVDDVIAEQVLARLRAEPSGHREVDDPAEADVEALEAELGHARALAERDGADFELEARIGTLAWEARCAARQERVRDLEGQVAAARRSPDLVLGRSARAIADDWEAGRLTVEDKRDVVASMVQAVFLRRPRDGETFRGRMGDPTKRAAYLQALRGRVHIVWLGDPEVEVPRPGRRYEPQPFEF